MLYFKKEGELHRVREAEVIYIQQLNGMLCFLLKKGSIQLKTTK